MKRFVLEFHAPWDGDSLVMKPCQEQRLQCGAGLACARDEAREMLSNGFVKQCFLERRRSYSTVPGLRGTPRRPNKTTR